MIVEMSCACAPSIVNARIGPLPGARPIGAEVSRHAPYRLCHDGDGGLVCVIAEVHNTYRQRHRYLLRTDGAGRATTRKEFPVSPFYPVDGYYRMSVPEPGILGVACAVVVGMVRRRKT